MIYFIIYYNYHTSYTFFIIYLLELLLLAAASASFLCCSFSFLAASFFCSAISSARMSHRLFFSASLKNENLLSPVSSSNLSCASSNRSAVSFWTSKVLFKIFKAIPIPASRSRSSFQSVFKMDCAVAELFPIQVAFHPP